MKKNNLASLTAKALEVDEQEARDAGALGFMSRALVQATIPHRKVDGAIFSRKNGNYHLSIMANPEFGGIPYGSIPRLLLSWIATEAVRTKQKDIMLGQNLSDFMEKLDLGRRGGERGDITRLKKQMDMLLSASISCIYRDEGRTSVKNVQPIVGADIWWDLKKSINTDTTELAKSGKPVESHLILGEEFFKENINYPVPIDMRVLKAIKQSSLAIDIYCWLTYRMSYLRKKTCIPWRTLEMQFGSDYKLTRQFKAAFLRQLGHVLGFYSCKVEPNELGLILFPSPPHIKRKN
jgi:hypothetical protein